MAQRILKSRVQRSIDTTVPTHEYQASVSDSRAADCDVLSAAWLALMVASVAVGNAQVRRSRYTMIEISSALLGDQ
jgi:hypothetical protein